MYATVHPVTRPTTEGALHTALMTTAAVIVGSFLIGLLLVVSVMLAGPVPATEGAPLPQQMPQPSAAAGLDR